MPDSPGVIVNPAIGFGRPTLKGVHTEAIADMYWVDDNPEGDFGLTRHQLLVAAWFEGTHGQPRYKHRWKRWARDVAGPALWRPSTLNPDALPLPPTKADG